MTLLSIGDRITVTAKKHPVHIGQTGEILTVYNFSGKPPAYKVRVNDGPICVIEHESVEAM